MSFTADPAEGKRVHDLDRAHVFHSWSAQAQINPMDIAAAEGCYVWDYDGNRYLDLSSQLVNVNIGHQHPKVVKAIQDQAAKMATIAPQHANDVRGEAAKRIVDVSPEGMNKVFFTNGGADANENAVRMARLHTGKQKVLSAYRSYHGNTAVAIQATGDPRRWPNEYARTRCTSSDRTPTARSFWSTTPEQESERALQHLEQVIQFEGPGTIAAILLESVVGTAGVLIPPPGLPGGRPRALRHATASSSSPTRSWPASAAPESGSRSSTSTSTPDLITFAKGSNSGYVPVGGVIISDAIAATFDDRVFPGGLTYSGHPLAAASIVASIDAMKEEGIVENAARIGEDVLGPGLRELADTAPRRRRGPRAGRLLGARPRHEPRDARAARPVRRHRRRRWPQLGRR